MSEHFCKDCKRSNGNTCKFTGAIHNTGIECPSFGPKEKEVEMFKVGDKVRVVADKATLRARGVENFSVRGKTGIVRNIRGTLSICYEVEVDIDNGIWEYYEQDLELIEEPTVAGHTARTSVGHPEGVLDVKEDISMESYKSGATRTQCETKIDPEGFFSPLVVLRYSEYMHKCRVQANGSLRDSDNWQGGIPLWRYMKGKWRHFLDTWLIHRGYKKVTDEGLDLQDCLCAEMFNTMGYLHEVLCEEKGITKTQDVPAPGGAHANFKACTAPVEGGY